MELVINGIDRIILSSRASLIFLADTRGCIGSFHSSRHCPDPGFDFSPSMNIWMIDTYCLKVDTGHIVPRAAAMSGGSMFYIVLLTVRPSLLPGKLAR